MGPGERFHCYPENGFWARWAALKRVEIRGKGAFCKRWFGELYLKPAKTHKKKQEQKKEKQKKLQNIRKETTK